jgi:single-strand DNA-binding protein
MTLNQIPFTAAGNLTRDPELRYAPSGKPVATVRVAVTPRQYSAEQQRYVDGATTYVDGQLWDAAAENIAESLHKGDRVLVVGRWVTRVFTASRGPNAGIEQRRLEVVVEEIGPSMAFATATVTRNPRPDARTRPRSGTGGSTPSTSRSADRARAAGRPRGDQVLPGSARHHPNPTVSDQGVSSDE